MKSAMLAETVNAITAIGGHDNPPARHIVGYEAVASVKEKLKTVSEELEDFVELSAAVDIDGEKGATPEAKPNGVLRAAVWKGSLSRGRAHLSLKLERFNN